MGLVRMKLGNATQSNYICPLPKPGRMTISELIYQVLKVEGKPLTPDEIWSRAKTRGLASYVSKKNPPNAISLQLNTDIRHNQEQTRFVQFTSSPPRFGLREWQHNVVVPDAASEEPEKPVPNTISTPLPTMDFPALEPEKPAPSVISKPEVKHKTPYYERDLHPYLSWFAHEHLRCYTKTIDHTKSSKRGENFGEWMHPDIVGCYFPFDGSRPWEKVVVDFAATINILTVRLYSFELKIELSQGNLRESFFQCVSNSTWAHESYLVAANISSDDKFQAELNRLCTSFGVGVIELDVQVPKQSRILIPAVTRPTLDWETINKLANLNPDFNEFLERINIDLKSRQIYKEKYDAILLVKDLAARFADSDD